MNKNYYDILGIDKNASEAEIKKAYKKLAVKTHPDKFANKSENEQKEAAEKFKDINEAYEVLSDPQKKANYDRYGTIEGMPNMDDIFSNMNMHDFFYNGFNPFGNARPRQQYAQTGQSLEYDLNLSIEEIFNGTTKNLKYKRRVRCKTCNGSGGTGIKTCQHCNGTGKIVETHKNGFTIMQNISMCTHCNGTGKIVEHICSKCNGSGFETIEESIKITVQPGAKHGMTLKYPGKGSESKDPKGSNGDFHVFIAWNIDNKKYRIGENGFDVYELLKVSVIDCLLGATINHKLPSGEIVKINIPQCSEEGTQIPLFNKGILGRGNYIIVVSIQMPKSLTTKEKEIIRQLKK